MITVIHDHIFPAAFALLPPEMDSPKAQAMLLAIGLQESRFVHRRQLGPGPARGWWQFERGGGVKGVLTHSTTGPVVTPIVKTLCYEPRASECHLAIEHNDLLACIFARLLLWTVPLPLPEPQDAAHGWAVYLEGWRPGKPHRETWDEFYAHAWELVAGT